MAVASCYAQIFAPTDRADFARTVRQALLSEGPKASAVVIIWWPCGFARWGAPIRFWKSAGLDYGTGKAGPLRRLAEADSFLAGLYQHASSVEPYETLFHQALNRCQAVAAAKRRWLRFKHSHMTLNATLIELCAAVFDWARFQLTKGAIKLHLQLDHQGCIDLSSIGYTSVSRVDSCA